MSEPNIPSLSLISKGARAQFAIGVALISVIPLLAFWYLSQLLQSAQAWRGIQPMIILLITCATGITGFLILHKYPLNIVRLRGYLENMIKGRLPDQVKLLAGEDDLRAVEHCLNLILNQLQERLEILQTEKQTLQNQLFQLQKMESMGVMAAGVAHDFSNLLTGMSGHLQLLAMESQAPNAQMSLKEIETLIQRATELTHQMLVYAGRGRFAMEQINVVPLIKDMAQLLNASVIGKAQLEITATSPTLNINADPTQLRQVIMNLVINAAEAIQPRAGLIRIQTALLAPEPGGIQAKLIHGTCPPWPAVCIEVSDNGPGIPPDILPRIFDPFFTSKPRGRGLGLAVILGIVNAHKGAIAVDSEVGQGTRFRVLLPAA